MMKVAVVRLCLLLMLLAAHSCTQQVEEKTAPPVAAQSQALVMAQGWVSGSGWPADTLVALNSVNLRTGSNVIGDVAVIRARSSGLLSLLTSEAVLGSNVELRGDLRADSVNLQWGAHVFGDVTYNTLHSLGAIDGIKKSSLSLPLAITVPTVPNFSAGSTAVTVNSTVKQTLAPGSYNDVRLRSGTSASLTVLTLSGGVYAFNNLMLEALSRVECDAACEVRIKGRLALGSRAYIGPSASSSLAMSAVQLIVEGTNGGSSLDSLPSTAEIGSSSELKGFIFVPNGTLALRAGSNSIGKFIAKDIDAINADIRNGAGVVNVPGGWVSGQRWPSTVVTALNSVEIGLGAQIKGDVAVIAQATGATLKQGYEAALALSSLITGNLSADSVQLPLGSRVTGKVSYNNLSGPGSMGSTASPLSLPLDITAPAFPAFSAGTAVVDVAATADRTLAPGDYALIKLRSGNLFNRTVVTLSGGTYNVADLEIGDYVNVECAAACEVRVKNRVEQRRNGVFGPKSGSGLDMNDVRLFVEGKNGGTATPDSKPSAAAFGASTVLSAFVFVPNGTLALKTGVAAKGRLVARDIDLAELVKVEAAGVVITPPSILAQPTSVTVRDGESATFSATATGTSVAYQWQRDGIDLPGATSASYTQAPATIADNGAKFRVIVSNAAASVTSSDAVLTVNPIAPAITTHPVSLTVNENESASFTCAASGSAPTYQWQKNGAIIPGATATTLTLNAVTASDAGTYTCVASNAAGSATSNPGELTVALRLPTIVTQPSDQRVAEGQSATFSVGASGTDIRYQWRKAEQPIAGATSSSLTLTNVAYTAAATYDCVVSNSGGSVTTRGASLTVELRSPVITQHPSSLTVTEGGDAAFSCGASGTLLSYQWDKDGVEIAGANTATFAISPVRISDAGAYRCVASNSGGSVASNAATLSVNLLPPVITEQPAGMTVVERQSASFSCNATGSSVSYRWQKNSVDIAGADARTFGIASVTVDDAADYRCVASNSGGAAASSAAPLRVDLLPPQIISQPSALSVDEDDPASFFCAASGTQIGVQWQKDSTDIPGATSATYSITKVRVEDAGAYRCVVTNSGGTVTSTAAALTVARLPPVITTQPVARTATEHTATSFSCAASGTGVSYRWQENGQDIAGSSGTTYAIADVQASDAGDYACVATNSGGSATSQAATLTVKLLPPVITDEPQPLTVIENQAAAFRCSATGTALSYRWQKNGQDIAGAGESSYTLPSAQHTDAGDYRCVVSNTGGSVSSQGATLTVQLLPPRIVGGPSSLTVTENQPASFSCTPSGTLLSYEWLKDDLPIAGAVGQTYGIAKAVETDEAAYRCVVTNSAGSATSDPAILSVQALPPVITQQPTSRTALEHSAVTFTCGASGSGVTYRWQKDGADIVGATAASFSIADVLHTAAGAYRCIATNESASATSDSATLTVTLIAPTITSQPQAITVVEQAAASFSCQADGTLVDYRWQKAGADIAGATGATFTIAEVSYEDRGDYRCVALNSGGSATSDAATLSVQLLPPRVAAGPLALRVYEHETAIFHCLGEGTLLSYQWQKDDVDLPGAIDQDLTLVAVSPLDAADYRCVIRNAGGSVLSQPARLTVDLLPPSFPTQPSSVTVTEGEPFQLTCTASGTALSFQWSKDGTPLTAATSGVYAVEIAEPSHAGLYTCSATNSGGSATSAEIPVAVNLKPPVILEQPSDTSVNEGQAYSFTVTAQGTQLHYQWQRNGADIPGATGTTYTRSQATTSDDGATYHVIVTNSGGTAQSRAASVQVTDASAPTLSLNGASEVTVTGNTFTITGSAGDSGSGVHEILIRNDRLPGQDLGVVLDSAGAFTGDIPLSLGTNNVTVIVRDARGNETQKTITITVSATEQPQLTILEPANNATVQTDTINIRGRVRSTLPASEIKIQLGSSVQFASGTGPDYTFSFDHVRLIQGPNQFNIVAETTRGNAQANTTVNYGSITPPPATPTPPVIQLQVSTPDQYFITDAIPVVGTVQATRCVQSITVNDIAANFIGNGTIATFSTALSFAALGAEDVNILVRAIDCDGKSGTASFIAHRDNGAPVISIDHLQLAPAVNEVVQTPYRLTGTISDRALAGFSIANQSVVAQATGTPGHWSFSVDVPLQRQTDRAITIEAWDASGLRSAREVVLRLAADVKLEILAPVADTKLLVKTSSLAVPIAVTARALGMMQGDVVFAQLDSEPRSSLARSGSSASGVLSLPPTAGVHTVTVTVESAQGTALAQSSVNIALQDEESIPLAVISQEPAADSSDVESNTPIILHFNRAIDPSKLTLAVVETAHGKLFAEQREGADLTTLSEVKLIDVDRSREQVPGEAQNLPENRMVSFYPSRDYAYGGTVFVDMSYDGTDLYHSKFQVRPLPSLIHGFVANEARIPLQGIEVSLPQLDRTAVSDADGNWNFGFGDLPSLRIPPGRYRAVVNPARKHARFGSVERFIELKEGLAYAGTTIIAELNSAEPFRHIATGQTTPALLAHGDLTLDLTQATLTFVDGLPEGDVHVQFLPAGQLGHTSLSGSRPDWAFSAQPPGIKVEGNLSVTMELPKLDGSYSYLDSQPARMLLVGLDPTSLMIAPVGVVEIDRTTHRARSVGPLHLQRLDYIGVSSVGSFRPELLDGYVAREIGLAELVCGLEAMP